MGRNQLSRRPLEQGHHRGILASQHPNNAGLRRRCLAFPPHVTRSPALFWEFRETGNRKERRMKLLIILAAGAILGAGAYAQNSQSRVKEPEARTPGQPT